jgi:hypothetical protein
MTVPNWAGSAHDEKVRHAQSATTAIRPLETLRMSGSLGIRQRTIPNVPYFPTHPTVGDSQKLPTRMDGFW